MARYKGYDARFSLRMPKELVREVEELGAMDEEVRNDTLIRLIRLGLKVAQEQLKQF